MEDAQLRPEQNPAVLRAQIREHCRLTLVEHCQALKATWQVLISKTREAIVEVIRFEQAMDALGLRKRQDANNPRD